MARRSIGKENIRNIQKSGGMYFISVPIALIRDLKWRERQKVVVEKTGRQELRIRDWKK